MSCALIHFPSRVIRSAAFVIAFSGFLILFFLLLFFPRSPPLLHNFWQRSCPGLNSGCRKYDWYDYERYSYSTSDRKIIIGSQGVRDGWRKEEWEIVDWQNNCPNRFRDEWVVTGVITDLSSSSTSAEDTEKGKGSHTTEQQPAATEGGNDSFRLTTISNHNWSGKDWLTYSCWIYKKRKCGIQIMQRSVCFVSFPLILKYLDC